MIKEIKFPLPNIKEVNSKKAIKKQNTNKYDYIRFDRDPSFVTELAEMCSITEELALELLTVFFDEIKQNLLTGHIICFKDFGKLYIASSNMKMHAKIEDQIDPKRSALRFKTFKALKKKLAAIYKTVQETVE